MELYKFGKKCKKNNFWVLKDPNTVFEFKHYMDSYRNLAAFSIKQGGVTIHKSILNSNSNLKTTRTKGHYIELYISRLEKIKQMTYSIF